MKILCLHGKGTSAVIFQSQTAALRSKLDSSYQFDFVDAPFRCETAPGINVLFDSPTYTWWLENTPAAIREAHRWLDAYLAAHEPYDMAMGFSQGCLLINTYLMCRQRRGADGAPPPFRAAMFICGGVSLPMLEDLGAAVTDRARRIDERSVQALHRKAARLQELAANPESIRPGVGLWDDTSDLLHTPGCPLPPASDVFGLDVAAFPPDLFLALPTAHVIGAKDPRVPSGMQLAHMCTNRAFYDHGGGHDIPRTSVVSLKLAGMIEQLARDVAAAKRQDVAAAQTA